MAETALERFGFLEAPAQYFDGRSAGRRDVTVRIGADSLTLYDADGAPVVAWPLATIRRLPGSQPTRDELRVIPSFESEERLVLRDAHMIAALEQVCVGLDASRPAQRGMLRRIAMWSLIAIGSVLLILFVIAPRLADVIAPLIPVESEIALGKRLADEIAENGAPFAGIEGGVCETPEGRAALDKMIARLETVANAPMPLVVRVLRSEEVNAFALPGGQMFFLVGLLKDAAQPEEAAGVLAHEIGHVVAHDPTRNVMRSFASGVVISTVLGDFLGGFLVISMVNAAVDATYSRDAERAADETAIALLQAANLPSAPLADFFAKLRAEHGDGGGYFASHPDNLAREEMFRTARGPAEGAYPPVLTDVEWRALQRICADSEDGD